MSLQVYWTDLFEQCASFISADMMEYSQFYHFRRTTHKYFSWCDWKLIAKIFWLAHQSRVNLNLNCIREESCRNKPHLFCDLASSLTNFMRLIQSENRTKWSQIFLHFMELHIFCAIPEPIWFLNGAVNVNNWRTAHIWTESGEVLGETLAIGHIWEDGVATSVDVHLFFLLSWWV